MDETEMDRNEIMKQPFDQIANDYDQSFTYSTIGKVQRSLVWNYLEKVQLGNEIKSVLEINCGTGEDALWLAKKGINVLATDISEKMIKIANKKGREHTNVSYQVTDFQKINNRKFDLIFSNFGGLNCISPSAFSVWLNEKMPSLLKENGRVILVIMPKFCLSESLFFLVKLQLKKVFRRLSKQPLEAKLDAETTIKTWYHSAKFIRKNIPNNCKINDIRPIGFFIPPSYLNSFVEKRPNFFRILLKLENRINQFSFFANFSDHYLIEIQMIK
ncbi:methyltransferase domain-containing protein [Emticicia sp. SJ17W-69]|uniref:class I SAM-dependent methyltransferase n=1 Tax=Emticicia sp. SJ17W-69 TaxID=3421657 RepID=UPI003EC153FD